MRIRSQDDWWKALVEHKEQLRDMTARFHPRRVISTPNVGPITAGAAEAARQRFAAEIAEETDGEPVEMFDRAVEEKDWKVLTKLLGELWFGVPESMCAWSVPGFAVLCDLCSECWVFEEER